MKSKQKHFGYGISVLVIAGIIFINGCVQQQQPQVQQTQQSTELPKELPKVTELVLEREDLKLRFQPTVERTFSGTITVTVENLPEKTTFLSITIASPEFENQRIDRIIDKPFIGLQLSIDTTEVKNGEYILTVLARHYPYPDESWKGESVLISRHINIQN